MYIEVVKDPLPVPKDKRVLATIFKYVIVCEKFPIPL
jgi:hypothetical protein